MQIHDLLTLTSLAAQHPNACILSTYNETERRYYDHAGCFVLHSHPEDVNALFGGKGIWTVKLFNGEPPKRCEFCSVMLFTKWPEELCESTTS